jgi:putative ATP-binding cassette transporter
MTAIEQKSLGDVYLYLTLSIFAIFFTVPIEVYYNFIKTRLSLLWRQWLSQSLIDRYFVERLGLTIESSHEIDNPEQRITQDVDTFCNSSVRLSITILDASVNVCTFIVVLWHLSPVLAFTVIAYSTMGLLIVSNIGRTLIALSDRQIAIEADLRSTLKEARAQLIKTEKGSLVSTVKEAQSRLLSVVSTLMNIMMVHKNIQLFTGTYNHLMPLIPAVIMAPAYIAGDIQFGVITQAVLAFTAVFNGATVLIGHFGDISHFAAIVNRLGSLSEKMAGNGAEQSKVRARTSLSR